MQIYSHYLSAAQALNADNYPANMEFHLIPPSIQPTEFGGIGEYFAVYRGEIDSATYFTDSMGYQTPFRLDERGNPICGLDIYRDTPAGISLVGSVALNTYVSHSAGDSGSSFAFCGKWLCVLGAYTLDSLTPKLLRVDCETLAVDYFNIDMTRGYGNLPSTSGYVDGHPFVAFARNGGGASGVDFFNVETGVMHSGFSAPGVSVLYGNYMLTRYGGGSLSASKLRTSSYWDGTNNVPVVEVDPDFTTSISTNPGNSHLGMLQAPLDGGYTFSDSLSGKLFVFDTLANTLTYTATVSNYNSNLDSNWGKVYYTGPNHTVLPNYTIQNGGNNSGQKSGFGLYNLYASPPTGNASGGYDPDQPYFGKYVATNLMRQTTPATPANLTTIPVKHHGLVSLHRGLVKTDGTGKIIQFGVTDWQNPTSWEEAAAAPNCAWFFDAASPVGQTRNDTLFTLDYKADKQAWVIKNRHSSGLHGAHAYDIKTGTRLRVYSLVETDSDLAHGYIGVTDASLSGGWRLPYDTRPSGNYETQYASSLLFSGQRSGGGNLTPTTIAQALDLDALYYLQPDVGG